MDIYIRMKVVGKAFLYACGDSPRCIVKFGCTILSTYNILKINKVHVCVLTTENRGIPKINKKLKKKHSMKKKKWEEQ